MAALGRQSSFNPRAGIHVSRAPLALRAPTQGQPWVRVLGGAPGGSGPGQGITCAPRTGLNRVTQCTRLESISGVQRREGEEVEMKQPVVEKRGISTAGACKGLGLGKGAACGNVPGSNSCRQSPAESAGDILTKFKIQIKLGTFCYL